MLIAGQTWRAALLACGKRSGPPLTGPAPVEQRGREDPPPPGQGVDDEKQRYLAQPWPGPA